jgi:hypothetical protein
MNKEKNKQLKIREYQIQGVVNTKKNAKNTHFKLVNFWRLHNKFFYLVHFF